MPVDNVLLNEVITKVQQAVDAIVRWVMQTAIRIWEQLKEAASEYLKYKLEIPERPVYGYIKHKTMQSQVLNRKPMLIRARTTC